MVFIDSNVILRYFTEAPDERAKRMQDQAENLFRAVIRGEETITLSEVVLHESCFIMASNNHYGMNHSDVVRYMRQLMDLPGLKLERGEKRLFSRALDIYQSNPKLEFSDSVIAARSERLGVPLATFDKQLSKLQTVQIQDLSAY